jgi:hypothetical protein
MLTKYQLHLLQKHDFDLGKFIFELNAKDENGINWFVFYENNLNQSKKRIAKLESRIKEWESADLETKRQILFEHRLKKDKELNRKIEQERVIIKGLSKIIHELTSLSSEGKLDSLHIQENPILTEMLEEISERNEKIEQLKQEKFKNNIKLESYLSYLKSELAEEKKKAVENAKNNKIMMERKKWIETVFGLTIEEQNKIIENYNV